MRGERELVVKLALALERPGGGVHDFDGEGGPAREIGSVDGAEPAVAELG